MISSFCCSNDALIVGSTVVCLLVSHKGVLLFSVRGGRMAAAGEEPTQGYWSRLYDKAQAAPCFREPMLWGLACGFLAGVHKFRVHRKAPRAILLACDFAVLGMGVSTSIAWWMCMQQKRKEEVEMQQILAIQGFKHMSELPHRKEGRDQRKRHDNENSALCHVN